MSFTFYGHANIVARTKALCEVEGGPAYEILLTGEASLVSYAFNLKEIDYGLQVGIVLSIRGSPGLSLACSMGNPDRPLLWHSPVQIPLPKPCFPAAPLLQKGCRSLCKSMKSSVFVNNLTWTPKLITS